MNTQSLWNGGSTVAWFQAAHRRDRDDRPYGRDASESIIRPVVTRIRRAIAAREIVVVEILAVAVERSRICPRVVESNRVGATEPHVREAEAARAVALAVRQAA